jgi:hypothetical protein
MSERKQRATSGSASKADQPVDETPQDQRNERLDEDTACCLAEVESEKDKATREFDEIKAKFERVEISYAQTSDELRVWQAEYAHLGLRFGEDCCGSGFYRYESE